MSTQRKAKTKKGKAGRTPASIVWFEIPADNVERAKKFYGALFGWKIEKFPGQMEYWHIDTGGGDDTPDGGMMKRQAPEHTITNLMVTPFFRSAFLTASRNCFGVATGCLSIVVMMSPGLIPLRAAGVPFWTATTMTPSVSTSTPNWPANA